MSLISRTASLRDLPETCLPSGSDTNTGSSASLSRIKTWLDICTSSHPACSQADSQPPSLPTRVVAVGSRGSSKCYLVSGNKKNGHYATLSHCWGDPNNRPLSTTDQTLPCRQRGIEDEALPKTFRHAVKVCREIGIEYIWIDSLCIIQEQETQEDWAKEAPKMGVVYGNSILNISAAAAADSTQGLWKERLGLISWPCPIVVFGQACHLYRYPLLGERMSGEPDNTAYGQDFLVQRAWVLQEQILSRRSIMFSTNGLIWRCPTLSTNEKYPLGILHAPDISHDHHRLLHCIVNGITSLIQKEPATDSYSCWYQIVTEYTSRSLTYEEDELPAIAGIAKRFGMAVNDSYHAGLWRRDMIIGLLWEAGPAESRGATRSARAPSWSWASIKGGVDYKAVLSYDAYAGLRRTPLTPLYDILDVSDPVTCENHPFGVTSRASLGLYGVLLAVTPNEHHISGLALVEKGIPAVGHINYSWPDTRKFSRLGQVTLVCLPVTVCHGPQALFIPGDGERYKASWKRSLETGIDEFEAGHTLYCLVLQTIPGNQDTYSRVGLCSVGRHKTIEISRMALFGERRSIILV